MGRDGQMYYVDPVHTCDEDNKAKYDRASDVFNSQQGVLTHNLIHHHSSNTGGGLVSGKKVALNHNRSSGGLERPQSSGKPRVMLAGRSKVGLATVEEVTKIQVRPQSSYKIGN